MIFIFFFIKNTNYETIKIVFRNAQRVFKEIIIFLLNFCLSIFESSYLVATI